MDHHAPTLHFVGEIQLGQQRITVSCPNLRAHHCCHCSTAEATPSLDPLTKFREEALQSIRKLQYLEAASLLHWRLSYTTHCPTFHPNFPPQTLKPLNRLLLSFLLDIQGLDDAKVRAQMQVHREVTESWIQTAPHDEVYWRWLERIPQDAAGQFFPLPKNAAAWKRRAKSIRRAKKHTRAVQPDYLPPDARRCLYLRRLQDILANPAISVQQALKDAWILKLDKSDYCLSWSEQARVTGAWWKLYPCSQTMWMGHFLGIEEPAMQEWKWQNSSSAVKNEFLDRYDVHLGTIHTLEMQAALQSDLAAGKPSIDDLSEPVSEGTLLDDCPICYDGLRREDVGNLAELHRPVQTRCHPVPHVFGKSCLDRALKQYGRCAVCNVGEGIDKEEDDLSEELPQIKTVGRGSLRACLEMLDDYVLHVHTPHPFQPRETELEDFAGQVLRSAGDVFEQIVRGRLPVIRQQLSELRVLGTLVVHSRLEAFVSGHDPTYRRAVQKQAQIRARQGKLNFERRVIERLVDIEKELGIDTKSQARPVESVEAEVMEAGLVETEPMEPEPMEPEVVEIDSVEPEPVEPEPEPVHSSPTEHAERPGILRSRIQPIRQFCEKAFATVTSLVDPSSYLGRLLKRSMELINRSGDEL
ncbi:hypothetical protein P154DRAFT_590190 [Amniculicola lignicola CBS 123094]|uniref:Uncharacterized protein n=1 Tax=Amniculicola lignicola CBS 123094 TaxID=1392246 RepID=A0A6A5WRR2_9PLEO|nr:hypothetical protein P154DRAFT_590190 [Amniculicola lignicola CBS 123094]